MKHMLLILTIFLFVAFVCSACTTESPAGETTEPTSEEITTTEAPEETTEDPTTEPTATEPPETEPPATPQAPFSKELTNLLEKLDNLWVDKRYYESPEIDKSVVYPFDVSFGPYGACFGFLVTPYSFTTGDESVIYPLKMKILSNEMVELTYDLSNSMTVVWGDIKHVAWSDADKQKYAGHKIIVDTKQSPIIEIQYYIGSKRYDLVRFNEFWNPSRYQVSAVDGGIRIAWQLPLFSIEIGKREPTFFYVYRSEKAGEKGEKIGKTEDFIAFSDESPYSFIDTSAKAGKKYYYSLWLFGRYYPEEQSIQFGDTWQIPADVDALKAAK